VQIAVTDNLERFIFIAIILLIAFYVYSMYLYRLKENANKVKLLKIVLRISAHFSSATTDNFDKKVTDMLKICGRLFKADRMFIYLFSEEKVTHEWSRNNFACILGSSPEFLKDFSNKKIGRRRAETLTEIPGVEITRDEMGAKRVYLNKNERKSLFVIPLLNHNKTIGLIVYASEQGLMFWKQEDQNTLEILRNILSDTLNKIKTEKHIRYLAYHDTLTDLPNKRYYDQYLTEELKHNSGASGAVIMINYKDFKLLNLTFGYNYANEVIKSTASKLKTICNKNRILFHISVDRFALYVRKYRDRFELEDLCNSIAGLLQLKGSDKITGVNIGIVEINKYDTDSDTILKYASLAANSVEENEPWGFRFFSDRIVTKINRQRQIELELKHIIDQDKQGSEIYLKYQPIVDLRTGKIAGFEALARMYSKKLGEISPGEFIPIAENKQQIYMLGDLIIRKACKFLKLLDTYGFTGIRISVNISALQILRKEFLRDFFEIINNYQIHSSALGVELTESVFSDDYVIINDKFIRLKEKGIQVAIDDFGTGYSSFARERELCVDCLKVDKFFVDKLQEVKSDNAITGDIISMAHKLGHSVIAEGVETEKQKKYLIEQNCDFMQGFLFSKPVPQGDAIRMLKEQ
ncbi:MAG TPA: bifunctional diguanylate cyclase/phosphodiesterase, partial [Halanaerobiales bacterium]|nr:bifunctional diguanylate cyclase/phosphodiesterase [Halanaerobiales bacterium]